MSSINQTLNNRPEAEQGDWIREFSVTDHAVERFIERFETAIPKGIKPSNKKAVGRWLDSVLRPVVMRRGTRTSRTLGAALVYRVELSGHQVNVRACVEGNQIFVVTVLPPTIRLRGRRKGRRA